MSALLQSGTFRQLWAGLFLAQLGNQLFLVVVPWVVLDLSGSSLTLSLVLVAASLPRLLLTPWAGTLADRHGPTSLLISSNGARSAVLLVMLLAVLNSNNTTWLILVSAAYGAASAFHSPASGSVLPYYLSQERIPAANALVLTSYDLGVFLGRTTGALLVATLFGLGSLWSGANLALLTNAATFLLATLIFRFVGKSNEVAPKDSSVEADSGGLGDAIAYLIQRPLLFLLFCFVVGSFFIHTGPLLIALPVLAKYQSGSNPGFSYSIYAACYGLGAMCGSLCAGFIWKPANAWLLPVLITLSLISTILTLIIGFLESYLPTGLAVLSISLIFNYSYTVVASWLQMNTPERILGRVMSLFILGTQGIMPVSMALTGYVIRTDARLIFLVLGSLGVVISLMTLSRYLQLAHKDKSLETKYD